ncbi:Telomere length regulation protein TEL2 [Manis javanica]|nr:Telomere length regulation protein TEL2 [Manis javanica]
MLENPDWTPKAFADYSRPSLKGGGLSGPFPWNVEVPTGRLPAARGPDLVRRLMTSDVCKNKDAWKYLKEGKSPKARAGFRILRFLGVLLWIWHLNVEWVHHMQPRCSSSRDAWRTAPYPSLA